jgi:O-antigen ligase
VTALALDRPRAVAERAPFLEGLFFATVFSVTFAKLQWEVAGTLSLSDVVTGLFLCAFLIYRVERFDGRLERAAVVTLAFFVAFLLVYLIGWFNLETAQSLAQWAKGMVKFLLHFLFLVAGVSLIARRGVRFYWLTLAAFVGGVAANAAYGVAQLAVAEGTGRNLDAGWLQPLTGGASKINIYGAIEGQNVFRINALTGDPNHLGIELAAVLVLMLPIYLRLERGHRYRMPLAILLGFLFVVELATLSRSGMLGLGCGFLVLLIPYRRHFLTARFLVPLAVVMAALLVFVARRAAFFEQVLTSRLSTEGRGSSTHFVVYDFIPDVLAQHPLFGLGLNTFSVYYEFQTGKTNFGPHSFYVASFVETGLVGTLVFAAFLVYLFRRAGATRHIGRALAAIRDPLAARVWPLGWGLTAALVSTMASNVFYLTMSFYYFYVIALLAIAAPAVFARRLGERPAQSPR